MNVLFPRIPLWDPDRFLKRWMPVVKVFFSKFGAVVWLAVVICRRSRTGRPHWDGAEGRRPQHAIDVQTNSTNYIYLFVDVRRHQADPRAGPRLLLQTVRRGSATSWASCSWSSCPTPYVDASSAWALRQQVAADVRRRGGHDRRAVLRRDLRVRLVPTNDSAYPLVNQLAYNAMLIASVSHADLQRQPAAPLRRLLHPVGPAGNPQPPPEEPWNTRWA